MRAITPGKIALRRTPALLRLAAVCLSLHCLSFAAATPVAESSVKSAYLFNFAKFVKWPPQVVAGDTEPIVFCLPQQSRLLEPLGELTSGKTIGTHPVGLRSYDSPRNLAGCQVVFIDGSTSSLLRDAPASLLAGILTASDSAESDKSHKAIVTFALVDDRLRFIIDNAAAQRAGLVISSKLMGLALTVRQ